MDQNQLENDEVDLLELLGLFYKNRKKLFFYMVISFLILTSGLLFFKNIKGNKIEAHFKIINQIEENNRLYPTLKFELQPIFVNEFKKNRFFRDLYLESNKNINDDQSIHNYLNSKLIIKHNKQGNYYTITIKNDNQTKEIINNYFDILGNQIETLLINPIKIKIEFLKTELSEIEKKIKDSKILGLNKNLDEQYEKLNKELTDLEYILSKQRPQVQILSKYNEIESKLNTKLIIVISFIVSFITAVMLVIVIEFIKKFKKYLKENNID